MSPFSQETLFSLQDYLAKRGGLRLSGSTTRTESHGIFVLPHTKKVDDQLNIILEICEDV